MDKGYVWGGWRAGVARENPDKARDDGSNAVRPEFITGELCHVPKEGVYGQDDKHEGELDDGDEAMEANQQKVMRRPYTPTTEDFESHMATHMPFREWRPHCVAGRAIAGRRGHEPQGRCSALQCVLAFFLSALDREENTAPILVLYDGNIGAIWALGIVSHANTT